MCVCARYSAHNQAGKKQKPKEPFHKLHGGKSGEPAPATPDHEVRVFHDQFHTQLAYNSVTRRSEKLTTMCPISPRIPHSALNDSTWLSRVLRSEYIRRKMVRCRVNSPRTTARCPFGRSRITSLPFSELRLPASPATEPHRNQHFGYCIIGSWGDLEDRRGQFNLLNASFYKLTPIHQISRIRRTMCDKLTDSFMMTGPR